MFSARTLAFLAVILPAVALADRPADINVSSETAASYGCGDACYKALTAAITADTTQNIGVDYDWDFYKTADNFTDGQLGDLLKLKPVNPTNLTTLSGVTAYRFQYVTEDLDGTYVPATGFIALPFTLPDSGKFPLVAYAHGTIGTSYGCAPSNGPSFYNYDSWEFLTSAGYAVVATDYAGLGSNATTHKYVAYKSNAKDVFYSLKAARQAFGAVLTDHWMSVGHSQGGATVWRLAEDVVGLSKAQGSNEADNYLGTVSLAPATRVYDLLIHGVNDVLIRPDFHKFATPGYFPLTSITVKRAFPSFNSTILGPKMNERMGLIEKAQLCLQTVGAITTDLGPEDLTTLTANGPGASKSDMALIKKFQDDFGPANGAVAHGPILLVQGHNDTAVLFPVVEESWKTACAHGSEVHFITYPKQDHSGVIAAASPDWIKWMDERFEAGAAGEKVGAPQNCTRVDKVAFNLEYARSLPEVSS